MCWNRATPEASKKPKGGWRIDGIWWNILFMIRGSLWCFFMDIILQDRGCVAIFANQLASWHSSSAGCAWWIASWPTVQTCLAAVNWFVTSYHKILRFKRSKAAQNIAGMAHNVQAHAADQRMHNFPGLCRILLSWKLQVGLPWQKQSSTGQSCSQAFSSACRCSLQLSLKK